MGSPGLIQLRDLGPSVLLFCHPQYMAALHSPRRLLQLKPSCLDFLTERWARRKDPHAFHESGPYGFQLYPIEQIFFTSLGAKEAEK